LDKPPQERRTHGLLLLGAGGSGKTHVIQKLVFEAVSYIWPNETPDSPSMIVTASSNAQSKNISTANVKARTMHNAAAMRVQYMLNTKMRPGDKLKTLERLWKNVKVLIIEEVSMVSAANYNMLDFRAMYGRQKTHNVN
jgi:DNA replication protein DnaC